MPFVDFAWCVIPTGGARICGSGLVCSGSVTAASLSASGQSGATATVSVPASVTLTSGSDTMSATLASSAATLTLSLTDSIAVGGVLSVAANQAAGSYTGTFSVTVDYQ